MKRFNHKMINRCFITVCSGILLILLCSCNLYDFFEVNPSWKIGLEYQYIAYDEERYLPIDQYRDFLIQQETEKLGEVQVEGEVIWGKLFFGDILYQLVDYQDIVYLWTDYDGPHADFYCRESNYETVCTLLEQCISASI